MKILVYIAWANVKAWQIPEEKVAFLRGQFPEITFLHARTEEDALQAIAETDVAFSSRLTPAMMQRAANLKWVHSSAAAVEGLLPLAELAKRNITLTNSRGVQAIPIAEQVIGH